MNKELASQAHALWTKDKQIGRFNSKHRVFPYREAVNVYEGMSRLAEQITANGAPQSPDQLHELELKRRLTARSDGLGKFLNGEPLGLEDAIRGFGLEKEDIDEILPWLRTNKINALDAIERLFKESDISSYQLGLSTDIPRIRQQAEGFAGTQISNYHQKLGALFEGLTTAGNYLHRITSEPTTQDRSYFNMHSRRLALGITAVCFELEDGTIQLKERELLRLFGHEGMGHALQRVITDGADLPFFLKDSDEATIASEEAVTQHYERVVFDDLKASKKTQRELRIADSFDGMYQEEIDTALVTEYNRKLFYYSILVMADKALGDPRDSSVVKRKIDLIAQVALHPAYAWDFVESNRHYYDSEGNFNIDAVGELRYASGAAKRALAVFEKNGVHYGNKSDRSNIDMTFLTGYFTPKGFVEKAELAVKKK